MAPVRACMRADSSKAISRAASRSRRVLEGSGMAKVTAAIERATSAITTINSISVKPLTRRRLLPGPDVGITTFATSLAIRAEAEDIDRTLDARIHVLVGAAPGIVGQLFQVGLPVGRDGR